MWPMFGAWRLNMRLFSGLGSFKLFAKLFNRIYNKYFFFKFLEKNLDNLITKFLKISKILRLFLVLVNLLLKKILY